jgi:hypothetical protein
VGNCEKEKLSLAENCEKKVYFGNFQVGKFVKKGLIEFFHIFSMLGKIWFFYYRDFYCRS